MVFKKPACRVCGLTLDDHPDQPCPRGINPQYLDEKIRQQEAKEAAAEGRKRARNLNNRKNRTGKRSTHKSLLATINRLKHGARSPPQTAQKGKIRKHAQTTRESQQKKKSTVFKFRQNFASKNTHKMEARA